MFPPLDHRNPAAVARQNSIEQIAANQFRPRRPERPRAQPKRKSFSLQHSLLDLGESSVTSTVRAGRPLNVADRSRTTSTGQAKRGRYCAERPQLPQGQSRSEKTGQKRSDLAQTTRRPRLHSTRTMSNPPKPARAKLEGSGTAMGANSTPFTVAAAGAVYSVVAVPRLMVWLNPAESTSFKTLFPALAPAPVLTNRSASTLPRKKSGPRGGSEGRWLK